MKNNLMKDFFLISLLLFLASCSNTKPQPSVTIVSEDPSILFYPDDPERVLKICDSVNQIRIMRLTATIDSFTVAPAQTLYVYVSDDSAMFQMNRTIDSLQSIIFTLKDNLEPTKGARNGQ